MSRHGCACGAVTQQPAAITFPASQTSILREEESSDDDDQEEVGTAQAERANHAMH